MLNVTAHCVMGIALTHQKVKGMAVPTCRPTEFLWITERITHSSDGIKWTIIWTPISALPPIDSRSHVKTSPRSRTDIKTRFRNDPFVSVIDLVCGLN
jgi:hypothetical protein